MGEKKQNVSVVGGGIAGIAVAIRMALKGYPTALYESNPYLGGKIAEVRGGGFRFDAGPSLFTMPDLIDELFELAGKNPRDYFDYEQLPIITKYFYEDETVINGYSNAQKFALELNYKTQTPTEDTMNFLEDCKQRYELTEDVFLNKPINIGGSFLSGSGLKSIFGMGKLKAFTTMHDENAKRFKNEKVVQLFDRYATYNGSNPFKAPATLNLIAHLEHNLGAFLPVGGMYSIVNALEKLLYEVGVTVHKNSPVTEIIVSNYQVKGVNSNGFGHLSNIVISNLDVAVTYKNLLRKADMPVMRVGGGKEKSTSAIIFYWGIKGKFKHLDVHNILFGKSYEKEFKYLFDYKGVYHDPTVYIYISSKNNASDAPEDHENWFTMINVPHNKGQDWDKIIEEARENILDKIERTLKIDIRSHIVFEEILDPRTIESRTGSYLGALYGDSSNDKLAAFGRHPNHSDQVRGLYFCGGSVHPGGGIPLCLKSAKIVADLLPNSK